MSARPPLPPFTRETAVQKVRKAEDNWNTRDPHRVSLGYTEDSVWRNRDLFITGREEIVAFLTAKWEKELDYVLRKSLWGFRENRIAVRFQYEWHSSSLTPVEWDEGSVAGWSCVARRPHVPRGWSRVPKPLKPVRPTRIRCWERRSTDRSRHGSQW